MTDDDTMDITRIRMDAEAAANLDISRDAQHTIRSADNLVDRSMDGELSTGNQLRADLMRRAEEKRFLEGSLGYGSSFLDYKRSEVGGIGTDREIRRELTVRSRQERVKREQRFGNHSKRGGDRGGRKKLKPSERRQAFNADSDGPKEAITGSNRQEFNLGNNDAQKSFGGTTIGFREPPGRNYNPYS